MPSANREERKNNDKCLQMDLLLTLLNFSCNFKFQECTLVKDQVSRQGSEATDGTLQGSEAIRV